MNFNISTTPDYALNTSLIEEVIKLYGVLTKFLVVTRVNEDLNVFGDYSHLKSDNTKIFDIYMLPEESEDWEQGDSTFNPFGAVNFENVNLFVSKADMDTTGLADSVTGNLVVLPNNKVMEITNTSWEVPGVNNLFTFKDTKSVLKLSCKPYDFKLISEIPEADISVDPNVPYESLDTYFDELITQTTEQDTEANVTNQVDTIDKTGTVDTKVQKPVVDKTEDSVWGEF